MSTDKVECSNCGETTSRLGTHCEHCFVELTIAVAAVDDSVNLIESAVSSSVEDTAVAETAVAEAVAPQCDGKSSSSRVQWSFSVTATRARAAAVREQPLRNCPAADAKGRLVACIQDELVMLSEDADGNVVVDWRLPTGGFIPGSPTIGTDGLIRVHSLSGHLYCVCDDGQLAWGPVAVGEPLGWASPMVDSDGITWISASAGGLLRIDAQGAMDPRPFYRCASRLNSTGVIHNGTLLIGADDQCIHAIDLTQTRGSNRWNHTEGRGRTGWYINTPLIMIDGPFVVTISRDDHLYAFELNGSEAWKISLPGQVLGSPVASTEHQLYFGAAMGQEGHRTGCFVCLDTRTRQIVWRYETDAPIESTPVLGNDGLVYFGDNAGVVHAVDAGGRAVWTEQVPAAIRSAGAILPNGRLMFGLDDGSLIALRCDATGIAVGWPKHLGTAQNNGFPLLDASQ